MCPVCGAPVIIIGRLYLYFTWYMNLAPTHKPQCMLSQPCPGHSMAPAQA